MGCLNIQANRILTELKLKIGINKYNINVNTFLTNMFPFITIKTKVNDKISVNAELVCSSPISDDLEMWWCSGWKVLWNNKIKALWPEG